MPQAQLEPIQITAPVTDADRSILTPEAVSFLKELSRNFEERRQQLLAHRHERQQEIDRGAMPQFLPQTAWIRDSDWVAAPMAADLRDRRVEITGPVDRKMIINALNSGASVFMADFEDSNSPTWRNNLDGQFNLRDAVNGVISYVSPEGKRYELGERTAVLMVRPRGWHLNEKHFLVDGQPISAGLFDFGLFFFHNAKALMAKGSGPYFYLPKLESYLEARLWNDVFHFAQRELGIPRGTIRATVLIETILAAFEMDEIIYELREHSAGLNCGRWDYIFSFIKKFRNRPDFVLPNRAQVTMERHFLSSYVQLLIETCHRRGVHAMGGMAAQIPIKNDPAANEQALEKVRQDKHRPQVQVAAADLLTVPTGDITEAGLRWNIDVGIQYLEAWMRGNGCVPIYNLMEDAATAEICRAQVWQWVKHGAKLDDGRPVTADLVKRTIADVTESLRGSIGGEALARAAGMYEQMMTSGDFPEFLTLVAYEYID